MNVPWETIGGFAGATGVGALCFLGVFLFLDGRDSRLFPSVEVYAKTATCGIVAAVPVLAVSYLLGLVATSLAQAIGSVLFPAGFDIAAELASIGHGQATPVSQRYLQLRQEQEVLGGTFVGAVLLGIGAVSEIRNLPQLRRTIAIAAVAAVLLGTGAFAIGLWKGALARDLATAAVLRTVAPADSLPLPSANRRADASRHCA